jgi:hypothetical protein
MVKFIEQYAPLEQRSVVATAHSGGVEVLQYFIDKGFTLNDPELCTIASNYGRREYLKLAVSHGPPMDVNVVKHCARYNDVDLIRELHSRGCKWFGLRCLIILDFFTYSIAYLMQGRLALGVWSPKVMVSSAHRAPFSCAYFSISSFPCDNNALT